jgi:hypothetical protein
MKINAFRQRCITATVVDLGKIITIGTKKIVLGAVMLTVLSTGPTHAAVINFANSNFTMLTVSGGMLGGTNDVVGSWDGTYDTAVNSTNFNMTLTSPTPFFGFIWTAHDIRVFGPGTYQFDTTCTTAQLEAGIVNCNNPLGPYQTQQYLTMTVGTGQIGVHMLFNWNDGLNIDIVNVWNQNAVFGPSPLWTGPAGSNSANKVWDLMSTDGNGDGINGFRMVDGPFVTYSTNFNLTAVPLPAGFWLFGSGLVGLFGFMRRRMA